MKKLLLASLSVVALGAGVTVGAAPAMADIISVTVTGTVSSGVDTGGYFGGGDLTGDTYVAQYAFDTSYGISETNTGGTVLGGGPGYGFTTLPGLASPSLGASLTINGATVSIVGAYGAAVYAETGGPLYQALAADSSSDGLYSQIVGGPTDPVSITADITILSGGNGDDVGMFVDGDTTLNLTTASYTQALPEPASMALLSVGMFGTGVLARRRRRGVTPTAG